MSAIELLAKSTGETLLEHTMKCVEFAKIIVEGLPFNDIKRQSYMESAILCCAFHDLGKACTGFQQALKQGSSWGGKRHEIVSAYLCGAMGLSEEQIFAVITHHKDIMGSDSEKVLPINQIEQTDGDTEILQFMKREFEDNRSDFNSFFKDLCFKIDKIEFCNKIPDVLGTGTGIPGAWLKGDENRNGQKKKIGIEHRKRASELRAIVKAADHLASSGTRPIYQLNLRDYCVSLYDKRHFQEKCEQTHGNIILKAPTGSGKTEALLYWSQTNQYRNGRLYYVLPYQASINAMHKRLSRIFGQENVGALHSNAISFLYDLQNETTALAKTEAQSISMLQAQLARSIYYPVRVCTPHQLLRLALKGKGWEYLYLETQNSCIVFDEIHTYDPLITGLTISLVKSLKKQGAGFTFASATLPAFMEKIITEEVGDITSIVPDGRYDSDREVLDKKRHNVAVKDGNLEDNLELIVSEVQKGKKVLVIANHVRTAQSMYDRLKEYKPCLLHSRFNKKDRNKKEQSLMDKDVPKVVIATQVVEVSLDIDYQVMFSEPAPIDALTQRFGRINRRGERAPENVYVFCDQVAKHNLYDKERVKRTIDLLKQINNPLAEADLVDITNEVYKEGYIGEELKKFEKGYNFEDIINFDDNFIAGICRDWVEEIISGTDEKLEVLPYSCYEEYLRYIEKGLWIDANNLLIPLNYNYSLKEILNYERKYGIHLVNCLYDSDIGLVVNEKISNFC